MYLCLGGQEQAIPKCGKSRQSRDLLSELRQLKEGVYLDAAKQCWKKICVAKAQLELKLTNTVGDNKKEMGLNILIEKASAEITWAHGRMRMVTSHTGTGT